MRSLWKLAAVILLLSFSTAGLAAAPVLSMAEGAGDSLRAAAVSELRPNNGRISPHQQDDPQKPSAEGQSEGTVQVTLINEINEPICYAAFSYGASTNRFVDVLQGDQIVQGESGTFNLPPGYYTVLLSNCASTMVYFRSYVNVGEVTEIHITELDRQIALCQRQNYTGKTNFDKGRYITAMENFYLALECFREIPYLVGEGEVLNNIGLVHMQRGQYAQAKNFIYDALDIAKETENLDGESAAMNSLILVDMRLGHLEEALAGFDLVLNFRRQLDDRSGEATALNNIAGIYSELGREEKALEYYEQVLLINRELNDRQKEANTLNNIAQSNVDLGNYDEALETFRQASSIVRSPGNANPELESAILNGIGLVHAHEERYPKALEAFEAALELDREQEDLSGESRHLYLVARALDDLGRQDKALQTYGEAMDVLESVRELAGSDEDRAGYVSQFTHLYEHALDLYYRLGLYQEAFYVAERGRARAFLDLIAADPLKSRDDPATSLDEQLLEHRRQISKLEKDLESERARPFSEQSQDVIDYLIGELEATRGDYERIFKRQRSSNPDYISLVSVDPLTISELQSQVLDEHTTLIEYFILEEYTLAWVIDQDNFVLVRLDISRSDLQNQVEFLHDVVADREYDAQTAASLYDTLFAPLLPHIRRSNLVIVPHNVLHYLLFAALLDAESERYLVQDYALAYAPSASALNFILKRRNEDKSRLLVMGNPDGSLPYAATEAEAIAGLYDATPLLSEEARESLLYAQAGELDILHLAAHGTYDLNHPLFTRIELAPDESQDGNLELHEVYGMDLAEANLVVLSACNTALGQMSEGDELVGLTRAFLFAGTPAILTTHWAIDDAATGYLMESFYSNLQNGRTNAEALRRAQLAVLEQDQWRQPYYWAAFSLTGDYRGQGDPNLRVEEVENEGNGICPGTLLTSGFLVILGLTGLLNGRKTKVKHD